MRLYRLDHDPASQLRLKIYRLGGLVPLSDVVPVLENFGFRVLEEMPTRLERRRRAISTNSTVMPPTDRRRREPIWRAPR